MQSAVLASAVSEAPGQDEKIVLRTELVTTLDIRDNNSNSNIRGSGEEDDTLGGEPMVEDEAHETGNAALREVLTELRQCIKEEEASASSTTSCTTGSTNKHRMAKEYTALGLIRVHMQGNAKEAVKCFNRAITILEQTPDSQLATAITLNDLAYCYLKLQKQDQAVRTYWEALRLFREQNVPESDIHVAAATRSISLLSSNGRCCLPQQQVQPQPNNGTNGSYKKGASL